MKPLSLVLCCGLAAAALSRAEDRFTVSGSEIPSQLLKINYGRIPAGIRGFDLNICNSTNSRQTMTSSEVYQGLAMSNPELQPVGKQIMLAAILRNQKFSVASILTVALNTAVGVLSVIGAARTGLPSNTLAGAAVGAMVAQQVIANLKPVLTADQIQQYETQVLEPALVVEEGACVERTMFALTPGVKTSKDGKRLTLTFHIR